MTPGSSVRRTYSELLAAGQPRTITSNEEADRIQAQIDAVIDKGDLSQDEQEYLSLLGDLVLAWEEERYDWPELSPVEYLRALLEDSGRRQADLVGPVFPTASIASEVLNGKRALTYDHVHKAAAFFHVSPALFFPNVGHLRPDPALERAESDEQAHVLGRSSRTLRERLNRSPDMDASTDAWEQVRKACEALGKALEDRKY